MADDERKPGENKVTIQVQRDGAQINPRKEAAPTGAPTPGKVAVNPGAAVAASRDMGNDEYLRSEEAKRRKAAELAFQDRQAAEAKKASQQLSSTKQSTETIPGARPLIAETGLDQPRRQLNVSVSGGDYDHQPVKSSSIISTIGVPIEINTDKNGKTSISIPKTGNLSRAEKIELGMNMAAVAIAKGACDKTTEPWTFKVQITDWQLRAAVTAQLEGLGYKVQTPGLDSAKEAANYNKNYNPLGLTYNRYENEIAQIKKEVNHQCVKSAPGYVDDKSFTQNPANVSAGFAQRFFKGVEDGEEHGVTPENNMRRAIAHAVFHPTSDKAQKRFEYRAKSFGGNELLNQDEKPQQRFNKIAHEGLFRGNGWTHGSLDPKKLQSPEDVRKEFARQFNDEVKPQQDIAPSVRPS